MEESELLEKLKHGATPHIRWSIRRDMVDIHRIEDESFLRPWSEDDFIRFMRERNNIGMVAEVNDQVVAYVFYRLLRSKLEIFNLAVDLRFRRHGIGKAIADKLKAKLSNDRRNRILLHVPDDNLLGQLFWKSQGFVATGVSKKFHWANEQDAYRMVYKHLEEVPA